jgi:hypothetical protein
MSFRIDETWWDTSGAHLEYRHFRRQSQCRRGATTQAFHLRAVFLILRQKYFSAELSPCIPSRAVLITQQYNSSSTDILFLRPWE